MGLSVLRSTGYAMLMSPNKGETAVHGCHCHGDMDVRMHKLMAIPQSWYVCFSANIDSVPTFSRLPQLEQSHSKKVPGILQSSPPGSIVHNREPQNTFRYTQSVVAPYPPLGEVWCEVAMELLH